MSVMQEIYDLIAEGELEQAQERVLAVETAPGPSGFRLPPSVFERVLRAAAAQNKVTYEYRTWVGAAYGRAQWERLAAELGLPLSPDVVVRRRRGSRP